MSAALLLTLAACNQSGRPPPQPYIGPDQAALNAQMGQVVDGAYVVAPGDTLAVVSERTNTPIRTLIDLNNLAPPYLIVAGQRLALHQRSHYVVQSGDTVSGLSKKLGVTQSALIQLNNLKAPYALKIGQTLNLPSQIEASNDPAPAPAASPSGGVSQAALPPLPGASSPTAPAAAPTPPPAPTTATQATSAPLPTTPGAAPKPQTGSKPLAPDASTVPAAEPEPAEPTVTSMPPAEPTPVPTTPQPSATQTAAAAPAASPAPAAPAKPVTTVMKPTGSGKFGWPVQGKVIGKFGGGSDGLKNDGINIAAPVGAPVNAAADGVVAYAGNQLRGFGNMILIRHADGYVTAYAHNQSLLVEKGAKVKRGQTIARVGSTGNVSSPQLHFEIRKGTEPVDPLLMLGG